MFFIFGSRVYGKVDQVPGLFHVATRFGHINFVPLIPMKSYIVLEKTAAGFRGVPIPLSGKSVLVTWLRIGSIIAAGATIILTLIALSGGKALDAGIPAVTAALAIGAAIFAWTYKGFTHASYQRANQLAELAGMNEAGLAQLRVMYGLDPDTRYSNRFEVLPVNPAGPASHPSTPALQTWDMPAPPVPSVEEPAPLGALPQPTTYFITGKDRSTGQDVCTTVWAADVQEAQRLAEERNVDAARVEPAGR